MQKSKTHLSRRWAILILALALLLTGVTGVYTAMTLRVNTDTAELLSDDLPFRQTLLKYEKLFPQNEAELVLVVEALTPEQADAAAEALLERLREHPNYFAEAYQPRGGEFFTQHALLYLETHELEQLGDRLARMQPLLAMLQEDPSLRGLFDPLQQLLEDEALDPSRVNLLLGQLNRVVQAQLANQPAALSWRQLIGEQTEFSEIARSIIIAQPKMDYGRFIAASEVMNALEGIAADMGLGGEEWPRLRITGKVALRHQETKTVLQGMVTGGPVALALIVGLMFLAFRSFYLALATLITLLVGLVFTGGFAALSVGRLNLISVAFALLYIGLGVDFAIHYNLRYVEFLRQGLAREHALITAAKAMIKPLALCALTTSIGFLSFFPSSFVGVSELGIIAGGGIFISLLVTLTVMPALLRLLPQQKSLQNWSSVKPKWLLWLMYSPMRHQRLILTASGVITVAALFAAFKVQFNTDLLDLREQHSESVQTLRTLQEDENFSAMSGALVLEDSPEKAQNIDRRLSELPEVKQTITVFDLIPDQQDEKLFLIEQLAFVAGAGLSLDPERLTIEPVDEQIQALAQFRDSLQKESASIDDPKLVRVYSNLSSTLTEWLNSLEGLSDAERRRQVLELHQRVLEPLPLALNSLDQALNAQPFTLETLPDSIRSHWVSENHVYRVEATPAGDMSNDAERRQFADAVQRVAPAASGSTITQVEAARAIVAGFKQALLYAGIGIVGVLLLVIRRVRLILLILLPLIIGGLVVLATMALFSIRFNFANVIALPLLLGVGIDNGIHMVHRSLHGMTTEGGLLKTSTARGIWFSTLTTLCGFGGLALSPHPGTASMGLLLAIGIGILVICTLVLLPALLHLKPANSVLRDEQEAVNKQ